MIKKLLFVCLLGVNIVYGQENNSCYCFHFDDTLCNKQVEILNNSNNIWQISIPSKGNFTPTLYSSPEAILTDSVNSYPINNNSSFIIKSIAGMGDYYGLTILNGDYFVETDSLKDFGTIEFSPNNGQLWVDIINDSNYVANLTWFSNKPVLTGKSNGWNNFQVLLADLGSLFPIQIGDTLLYRFTFKSDSIYDNLAGLMFDNICFYDFVEGVTEVRFKNIKSTIYPNPSIDFITIEFDNNLKEIFQLSIYTNNSKLVYSEDNISGNKITTNIQSFNAGEYIYKLTNANKKERSWGKFVKL